MIILYMAFNATQINLLLKVANELARSSNAGFDGQNEPANSSNPSSDTQNALPYSRSKLVGIWDPYLVLPHDIGYDLAVIAILFLVCAFIFLRCCTEDSSSSFPRLPFAHDATAPHLLEPENEPSSLAEFYGLEPTHR